jgi:HK97 family phage portal protein
VIFVFYVMLGLGLLAILALYQVASYFIPAKLPRLIPRIPRSQHSEAYRRWARDFDSTMDESALLEWDTINRPEMSRHSFGTEIRSIGARIFRRTLNWNKVFGDGTPTWRTNSGKRVSEESALKHSVVWAAATLIADAVSMLPPESVREDPVTGRITPVALPGWIRSPHPEMRRMDVINQLILSVLLWGNAYALLIRRESDGMIVGMLPLDPRSVTCEWDPDRQGYRRYKVDNGTWLTSAEIFHLQGPTLPGAAKGLSVIAQAREAIGLGLTLEEFGARYFSQGSAAKVIIKLPKMYGDEQVKQVMRQYEMAHKGATNWHRPAVATGGGDIVNVSIPPEDSQFLQSREFQAMDVARWFRVPPHRVGIVSAETSWGSGIAEQNMALHQTCFGPWIRRLEETFTSYAPWGEGRGIIIRLNAAESLRGTFKEQVEAWGAAVTAKIVTQNEARRALGLDPLPGGDTINEPPAPTPPAPPSGGQEGAPPDDDPATADRGRRPFPKRERSNAR